MLAYAKLSQEMYVYIWHKENTAMSEMKTIKKLSMYVNMSLMIFVIFAMAFFKHCGITYMVYHSIPTLACYVIFFILIHKEMLYQYARAVYAVITVYMVAGNICLGYNAGFHIYCVSLIPLSFYMVYMAQKLKIKSVNPLWISLGLVCVYLCSTVYVVLKGPVYEVDTTVVCICLVINSIAVFFFLIGYAGFMLKLVADSEYKLTDMANKDRLTGLSNRNYIMTRLSNPKQELHPEQWLAIADIDDFKKINDTYGHGCGDYVLTEIAKAMQTLCQGCTVCRWGGEEFLIIADTDAAKTSILEQLRQKVQETPFSYQGHSFTVTVTIGVSSYQAGQPLDEWIRSADDKLYEGKAANKNRVIY